MLPFTHEQFLQVFAAYNAAVWPAQVVAYLAGVAACAGLIRRTRQGARVAVFGLAAMWLWSGLAYHIGFFARINPAAYGFGALFIVQGVLLALAGASHRFEFGATDRLRRWSGWGLIVYSLVLYPLAGIAAGATYPAMPMFGITPCPVTLFTLGVLLLSSSRVPWWTLPIPLAWSLVGGSAAFLLGVPQDWPLLLSVLAVAPIVIANRRLPSRAGAPN
jgi:FtsH-binding integral membrane protein